LRASSAERLAESAFTTSTEERAACFVRSFVVDDEEAAAFSTDTAPST
jgi:hypothetical protein